jgi:hypothetical protein
VGLAGWVELLLAFGRTQRNQFDQALSSCFYVVVESSASE